jgi:co-chaperonin GroES (HSP10)
MSYTPLHDKIIVQRITPTRTTDSGIILQTSIEPDRAKVISVGPEVDEVQVDDELLVNWNGAIKIKDDLYSLKIEFVVAAYEA